MTDGSPSARTVDSRPATASESADPLTFTMRFTSTPRGARLARRMAEHLLDAWGLPYDSEPHDTLALGVAELCANAARHGRVPSRDFRLRLRLTAGAGGRRPRTDGPGKTVWAQCTRRTRTVLDELHRPTATARVAPRPVPAR